MIDKAAVVAAQEMVDYPNTKWDRPNRRDEVLCVARALLKLVKSEKTRKLRSRKPKVKAKKSTGFTGCTCGSRSGYDDNCIVHGPAGG